MQNNDSFWVTEQFQLVAINIWRSIYTKYNNKTTTYSAIENKLPYFENFWATVTVYWIYWIVCYTVDFKYGQNEKIEIFLKTQKLNDTST